MTGCSLWTLLNSQFLGTLLLFLTLVVLGIYAYDTRRIANASVKQLEASRLTTSVDLAFRLEERFDGPHMRVVRADAAKALLRKDPEGAEPVLDFFELVAVFTRKRALDLEAVWNVFSWWERRYFVAMAEWIQSRRQLDATLWSDAVWLDEEIQALHRSRNSGHAEMLSPGQIENFLKQEAKCADGLAGPHPERKAGA